MLKKNEPKKKWEYVHRSKAGPISLNGIKTYDLTLMSEHDEVLSIIMFTRHPIVALRRICSKPRSVREISRLHNKMVDDMDL